MPFWVIFTIGTVATPAEHFSTPLALCALLLVPWSFFTSCFFRYYSEAFRAASDTRAAAYEPSHAILTFTFVPFSLAYEASFCLTVSADYLCVTVACLSARYCLVTFRIWTKDNLDFIYFFIFLFTLENYVLFCIEKCLDYVLTQESFSTDTFESVNPLIVILNSNLFL